MNVTESAKLLMRLALSGTLLGWLLSRADLAKIRDLIAELAPGFLLLLVGVYLLGVLVAAIKWRVLLPGEPVQLLFRLNLISQFYSVILPGQIAGEAVKAYRLGKGHSDAEVVAASVLLDKITGLLSLFVLGLFGALMTGFEVGIAARLALVAFFLVFVSLLFSMRLRMVFESVHAIIDRAGRAFPRAQRIFIQLRFFVQSWRDYLEKPAVLLLSIFIGLAYQAVHIAIIVLLSDQLGFSLSILEWSWIFALVSVAVVMPISLGGVGVREGAFVGILGLFGILREQALALSLTIFALQLVAATLGAVVEVMGVTRKR